MMGKFPLLKIYRVLLWFASAVCLILALISIILPLLSRNSYYSYGIDVLSLVVVALPFIGLSLGFGIIAEIITLFLHMEDHLDQSRRVQEDIDETLRLMVSRPVVQSVAQGSGASLTANSVFPVLSMKAIVAANEANLYSQPDGKSNIVDTLAGGVTITIFGRTADNNWLSTSQDNLLWVMAKRVVLKQDISTLPIITPPPAT